MKKQRLFAGLFLGSSLLALAATKMLEFRTEAPRPVAVAAQQLTFLPAAEAAPAIHKESSSPPEATPVPPPQTLPTYKHPKLGDFTPDTFQQHDAYIIERTEFWNNHLRTRIKGYTDLQPELIKKMMLAESGGSPSMFRTDPLSVAHDGDTALEDLVKGDIRLVGTEVLSEMQKNYKNITPIPFTRVKNKKGKVVRAYWDLAKAKRTAKAKNKQVITARESIDLGILYLACKKRPIFGVNKGPNGEWLDWFVKSYRTPMQGAVKYNGGGDSKYQAKLEAFVAQ
ncbi:MAG: hypothetical protein QF486_00155 [Candidatus Woesearchaeota archaeon]|nr:hypothetical protein [Candidatus Woesearchaeota archaeon]MDP7181365.1 hypothetical protein [Candidatus Woesearchaeota archaeon]MDP7198017.1 hypothetical protein [Candidatus Woesearchaeota archaeon]MDP7466851.1 hypothetical protein [Candidatus Woesearchaeota archaeon]MDP7647287.1 hypothetical protein [Candidatus Woesearchaeota archaeon]